MQSPEYVQTSLAAAMTLGYASGRFHRNAELTGLNLLLTYAQGCRGRCAYCGLSSDRDLKDNRNRTFIRVKWPTLELDDIIGRTENRTHRLQRVCLSMVTASAALVDTIEIVRRLSASSALPISVLIAPTLIRSPEYLSLLRQAGAERIGIALDCATKALFEHYRGRGVGGPHSWDHYTRVTEWTLEEFGKRMVGFHFIVGLGESDQDMVAAIADADAKGVLTHLFSFFPEPGSRIGDRQQPGLTRYRRIQLARYLINERGWTIDRFIFGSDGELIGFSGAVDDVINASLAFMTSGCPGPDGSVACNRPFGNELPSQAIRNFPFKPEASDLAEIIEQLAL